MATVIPAQEHRPHRREQGDTVAPGDEQSARVAPQNSESVAAAFGALRVLDRPLATSREVAEALEIDPRLAQQLLRMARSPLCGVRSDDLTVARAVVLLGFITVRKMVVLSLCRDLGSLGAEGEADRWREALWVGIAAEQVARRIDDKVASEALMAGLVSVIADSLDTASSESADVDTGSRGSPQHLSLESITGEQTLSPRRLGQILDAATGLAALVTSVAPALPPTADVDLVLTNAGLGAMTDGRLALDIRRGFELYASLLV